MGDSQEQSSTWPEIATNGRQEDNSIVVLNREKALPDAGNS